MTDNRNPPPADLPESNEIDTDIDWEKVDLSSYKDAEPDVPEIPEYSGRDGLLHYFNQLAIEGFGLGVTVFVNGLTISGKIISGAEYITALQEPYKDFTDGTWAEVVHNDLEETKAFQARLRENPEYGLELNFLHLQNARVFIPGRPGLPSNGSVMRFKVDSIDGWSQGILGSD